MLTIIQTIIIGGIKAMKKFNTEYSIMYRIFHIVNNPSITAAMIMILKTILQLMLLKKCIIASRR